MPGGKVQPGAEAAPAYEETGEECRPLLGSESGTGSAK